MKSSVKLGRIAGVEIGANWSWPIAFALIVWLLAAAVFPASTPGQSDGAYVAMAVAAAVVFFACLVLHELGHALRARRDGVPIDGITLWLFGGVARFGGPFPTPGAELRIAVAGPAVSLALGIALVLLAQLPLPVALGSTLAWLGFINLVLLAFNLLPALPLDGGRVVRAMVWRLGGDFVGATRIAAGLGALIGGMLVALGIVLLATGELFAGMWLALIGWFVLLAAEGERREANDRSALDGVRVRDVMVENPAVVGPNTPLPDLADDLLSRPRHRTIPVVDGDRPAGLTVEPEQPASDFRRARPKRTQLRARVPGGAPRRGGVGQRRPGRVLELRTAEGKVPRAALDADDVGPGPL